MDDVGFGADGCDDGGGFGAPEEGQGGFGEHIGRYEIISVAETVRKDQAAELYRILEEDSQMAEERSKA